MAEPGFRFAVILAGMRTGSNLLEESLGSFAGVETHGELFNAHFFGQPGQTSRFGLSMAGRDADPMRVVEQMVATCGGFPVFRLFEDHDPRVLAGVLNDRTAAKIILSRPALDSWVSLKIARKTGQWWLGDARRAKSAKVAFDANDFETFSRGRAEFYEVIRASLMRTGQSGFPIGYDDLFDDQNLSGLAAWLGLSGERVEKAVRAKVQNPTPLAERLIEPESVARTLANLSAPDLMTLKEFEPPRGPGLRGFVAAEGLPVLYMPIRGAVEDPVADWLAAQPGVGELLREMTQKDLRQWWRAHPGHRSFTILRHPLRRAWDSFATHIMPPDGFADIRDVLVRRFEMPVADGAWSVEQARAAFAVFLRFLEANLAGQTSVRVDASWTSQSRHLSAISTFATPDAVLREETLAQDIARFGAGLNVTFDGAPHFAEPGPVALAEVVTPEIDTLCARAYRRDMLQFGFGPWADQAA